ncbi:MAG: GNAT family N-acetyltransferase [Chloroflexi bacterium]|nr:GNAT family N-acetyltransferase [Chloroflexota bacterium]
MKIEVIHAGKVVLRPKGLQDAPDDYAWRCDPELAELDATTPIKQPYQDFLRSYQDELRYPSPWSVRWAIDSDEGRHIGNCMCYDINTAYGEAELGIMIGDREYWSRSYGYDTMVGLIEYMFSNSSIRRLYLHTLTWNHRAQRCFEKCGMTPVHPVQRFQRELLLMELKRDKWMTIREEKLAPLRAAEAATNGAHPAIPRNADSTPA